MLRQRLIIALVPVALALGASSCTDTEAPHNYASGGSTGSNGGATGTGGTTDTTPTGGTTGSNGGSTGTGGATGGSTGSGGATGGSTDSGGTTGTGGATSTGGAGGSTGTGGATGGSTGTGGAGGTTTVSLSFATDIMPILTMYCHDCHQTGNAGQLSLKADANDTLATTAYMALVGTGAGGAVKQNTACKSAGSDIIYRVAPSDPTTSLLYLKITTPQATLTTGKCGNTMPNGKTQLGTMDAASTQKIHDWIMGGANP